MSDKPVRSLDEIRAEYSRICSQAGHCQYQLFTLEKDLAALNGVLRDLNLEAASMPAAPAAPQQEEKSNE